MELIEWWKKRLRIDGYSELRMSNILIVLVESESELEVASIGRSLD